MFLQTNQIRVVDRVDHFAKSLSEEAVSAIFQADEHQLMLESVEVADIEQAYLSQFDAMPVMMLEAIKAKAARLETRVIGFSNTLNKHLKPVGIEVTGREISKPRKSGSVAVQVAKLNLSDGQSVSLVFHAPDNDPLKINADDTLIAFRFLVNSRDVTHAVAPSGGRDISRSQMALALSNLVEKNSEKFAARQEQNAQQKQELEATQAQLEEIEANINTQSDQLDSIEEANAKKQKRIDTLNKQIANQNDIQEELRKQLANKFVPGTGENPDNNKPETTDSKLLGSPAFKAAADIVVKDGNVRLLSSLMNISGIDSNDPNLAGFDRSLFVSNLAGKLKTLQRQGHQPQVNNVLTMIAEYNKVATKPAFTKRHSIWKLGEVNDVPEAGGVVEQEEETTSGLHWYGLQLRPAGMGNTPSDAEVVKVLNAEEAEVKFPNAGRAIRHGAIAYAEALTPKQVSDFELRPLSESGEDFSLADEDSAETIVRQFLYDWMDENNTDRITTKQMEDIKFQVAASSFKQAFSKLLRKQDEFERRKSIPDTFKVWNASLSLVTPTMIEEEAGYIDVLVSDVRVKNEKALAELRALVKGKRMPEGWNIDKHGLDQADLNLDKEMYLSVNVESPLFKIDSSSNYGSYDIHYKEDGSFNLTYDEGSPITGAESLSGWDQVKAALLEAYVGELQDPGAINHFAGTDEEEGFNDLRVAAGLPAITGLDDSGEETKQHKDNSTSFADAIRALVKSVEVGALALKDGKLMLSETLIHNVPDTIRADLLNASTSARHKKKWASDIGYWLDANEGYDVNAPVVEVNGEVYDFNQREYDIITPGLFGKSWSYVGQKNPQELLRAFDLMDDDAKEKLSDAARKAYMSVNDEPDKFEAMKGATSKKLDEYIDENFVYGTKDFKDIVPKTKDKIKYNGYVYGVYNLYKEMIDSAVEQGYPISKSKGEKLFAHYLDLSDYDIRTISNAGMAQGENKHVGVNFEAMLKNEISKADFVKLLHEAQWYDPEEETNTNKVNKVGDIIALGDGQYKIVNIGASRVTLREAGTTDEVFSVGKEEIVNAGVYIEGINEPPVENVLDAETEKFKAMLKGLSTVKWFNDDGSMNYQGQDDIYDTLLVNGYSINDAMKIAQRIRIEHNGGQKPFIETYTDDKPKQQPEPQPEPVQEPEPVETNSEEQVHTDALRTIRDYSGDATIEILEQYQADIEAAYASFESAGTLDEHNDLLEAAFARLVELQSEVTV
jgi:hypothetical protein